MPKTIIAVTMGPATGRTTPTTRLYTEYLLTMVVLLTLMGRVPRQLMKSSAPKETEDVIHGNTSVNRLPRLKNRPTPQIGNRRTNGEMYRLATRKVQIVPERFGCPHATSVRVKESRKATASLTMTETVYMTNAPVHSSGQPNARSVPVQPEKLSVPGYVRGPDTTLEPSPKDTTSTYKNGKITTSATNVTSMQKIAPAPPDSTGLVFPSVEEETDVSDI